MVVVALALVGCANPERPSVQSDTVALPTPLRSFDASLASTLTLVERAMASAGERLDDTQRPYRPSEPQSLLQASRAVVRADLADPDDGYVLVYDLDDTGIARERAQVLADYLASGFGQTNFPVDAQFSVALVADTVISTWWSRGRSSDPERAEAVFDAVAQVGETIEVLK